MKRLFILILSVTLALSLVACGKDASKSISSQTENSTIEEFDEDKLLSQSITYAEEMANGNYDNIRTSFSEATKRQVSQKKLYDGWKDVVKDFGSYQSVYSSSCKVSDDYANIIVILKYEKNALELSLRYNKKNYIDGIWIKPAVISPEGVSNADFEEKPMKIGKDPFILDGMLTTPKNNAKSVVVIMVQGSRQSDMNEAIGENKPFEDIAHGLAKQGITTIRYHKRYFQHSNLAKADITVKDEILDDVAYAIQYAKQDKNLKNSKIIVLGHSLGGMLTPKIATDNKEVAGIISLAGSPRNLEDIIFDQNKEAIKAMQDKSDAEKEQLLKQVEVEIEKIRNLKQTDTPSTIMGVHSNYWNSLHGIQSKELAKNLSLPMLFLQGSADFQVLADVDYKEWQEVLKGKTNAEFHSYENLNHLFMKTKGKKDISDYDGKGTVEAKVIDDIANWIEKKI